MSLADKGDSDKLLSWCKYVLAGLRDEISKIDNLLDSKFLETKILLPAITFALERKFITEIEYKILQLAAKKQVIQAADIKEIFPEKISA